MADNPNELSFSDFLNVALKSSPWHSEENKNWADKDGSLLEVLSAEKEGLYTPPKKYFVLKEKIFDALVKNPTTFGVAVIRGPRRVGKTSTLKFLIKDLINSKFSAKSIFYISLDEEKLFELVNQRRTLKEHLSQLIRDYAFAKPLIIILDEVTFYRGWARAIKNLIDEGDVGSGVALIATGSHSLDLSTAKSELAGRFGPLGESVGGDVFFGTRRFIECAESLLGNDFAEYVRHNLGKSERRRGLLQFLAGYFDSEESAEEVNKLRIQQLMDRHYDSLHGVFSIYKCSGGYPRAFYEAILSHKGGSLNIADARYKDDVFNLLVNDAKKFGLDEEILKQILLKIEKPVMQLSGDFDTLSSGIISKEKTANYIDYLEKSGLFLFLPRVTSFNENDRSSKTPTINREKIKLVVADPLAFIAIYACSRNVTSIFEKTKELLQSSDRGLLFESIILAHLRYFPDGYMFENFGYAQEHGQAEEVADALLWYIGDKANLIIVAVEVKSADAVNEQDIFRRATELKSKYGVKRLIVVSDSKQFKIAESYVIIPPEIFLLIF